MTNQNYSVTKYFKKFWILLALIIILAAVFSSIFRSLTPWAKQYKTDVEQHLSLLLNKPVHIATMETSWYWFQPVIKLDDVTIGNLNNKPLHINKLLIGINLFRSAWHRKIEPGVLYVDDVHLVLREQKKGWQLDGFSSIENQSTALTPEKSTQIVTWLAQQDRLILRHIDIDLYSNSGNRIPIQDLNVSIVNNGGYYKLKGEARLDQAHRTAFQLLGDIRFDPSHIDLTYGQIYISSKNMVLKQWQALL
ncbi:MAG: hypothetical protein EPN84_05025, partial [Legionella sp.]